MIFIAYTEKIARAQLMKNYGAKKHSELSLFSSLDVLLAQVYESREKSTEFVFLSAASIGDPKTRVINLMEEGDIGILVRRGDSMATPLNADSESLAQEWNQKAGIK